MKNRNHIAISIVTALLAVAGCTATPTQRTAGQTIDDGTVTTRVKAALIKDEDTKARQINVETYRGVVQLNGFVDSDREKREASRVAKNVDGVRRVENNLEIRSGDRSAGTVVDDGVITAKVKTALIGDPRTKAFQIEVKTNSGEVQLAGFVDDARAKSAAAELARSVSGVRDVRNEIDVKN